jgi:membrane protease YdiL (CAAX protease family)
MEAMRKDQSAVRTRTSPRRQIGIVAAIAAWTVGGFFVAQFLVVGAVRVLVDMGLPVAQMNEALLQTVISAVIYLVAIVIVIGLPWWIRRYKTTREEVGLQRLPEWTELLLAPVGFIAYMITSGIVVWAVGQMIPAFNPTQAQHIGFQMISQRQELILAFITLVMIAPFCEELLFRGFLYGKLKKHTKRWIAIIITSVLFGAAHMQWNVSIDTFVLSVFLCLVRDMTKSLWPSIIIHMIKNGIAFYLLFINPMILNTLGS